MIRAGIAHDTRAGRYTCSVAARNAKARVLELREVRLKETTMRRRFDVAHRRDAYLSPAAQRMIRLLRTRGRSLFSGE